MNNSSNLILTAEGFTLRPELADLATAKSAKVLRHENPAVYRLRLHLRRETTHRAPVRFAARATAEHAGPDHVTRAEASEPEAAVHAVLAKLERALRDAAGARKRERHTLAVAPAPAV